MEAGRRAAATELAQLTGHAGPWSITDAARSLLLEMHGIAVSDPGFLTTGTATVRDAGLGLDLTVMKSPGHSMTLTSRTGRLVLHNLDLKVHTCSQYASATHYHVDEVTA